MNELDKDIRPEDIPDTNQAGEPNLWREVACFPSAESGPFGLKS